MYNNSPKEEQAAAEYLLAFIKHLYRMGKNSFEISKKLEINIALIDKLLKNDKLLLSLKERNIAYVKELEQQYPDPEVLKKKCYDLGFSFHISDYSSTYYFYCFDSYFKNIGPWQRQNGFTDALSFYFGRKKRKYTNSDLDVLAKLSTGKTILEEQDIFADRNLTPAYRLKIINDLADGCKENESSEKYNCSIAAIKQVADEYELELPFTEKSIQSRVVKAIRQGYNFDQLTKRFYNFNPLVVEELIKTYRILPASEGRSDTDTPLLA